MHTRTTKPRIYGKRMLNLPIGRLRKTARPRALVLGGHSRMLWVNCGHASATDSDPAAAPRRLIRSFGLVNAKRVSAAPGQANLMPEHPCDSKSRLRPHSREVLSYN
jgi:hypothetical protein